MNKSQESALATVQRVIRDCNVIRKGGDINGRKIGKMIEEVSAKKKIKISITGA